MTDRPPSLPHDQPPTGDDHGYGLVRCHGFDVEANGRPIGVVEEIRYGSRVDVPDLIAVRGGRLRQRLLLVPATQVERVDLRARRVQLSDDAVAVESSPRLGRRIAAERLAGVPGR